MARPKLGEGDTERLHVKITTEEMNAIDDWRYSNRVPSRSEAVRRLCASAMLAINGLGILNRMAEDVGVSALDDHEHIGGLFRGLLNDSIDGQQRDYSFGEVKNLLHDLSQRAYWQEQNTRYLNRIITGLHEAILMYAQPEAFSSVEHQAKQLLAGLDAFIKQQHDGWDEMSASHVRSTVIRLMSDTERAQLDAIQDRDVRIALLDKKTTKYLANQRRRLKRLRDKIRQEDEKIRQAAMERYLGKSTLDDSEGGEE